MKRDSENALKRPALGDLVIEAEEFEDGELAAALHGRLAVKKGEELVRLLGPFGNESAKKKLVACGLARHVMYRIGSIEEHGLAAPAEWFAIQTQQKPKSVGEELSRLGKEGLMERDEHGWKVPPWAIRKAIKFITE